jgi:cytidine deaminase
MGKAKRLALLGNTGVGKDTCVRTIQKIHPNLSVALIQLAAPLYEVQNLIYKICAREKNPEVQDGILLNFLGEHMRSINPNVIKEFFFRQLDQKESKVDLIICRDARPIDLPFITEAGFYVLHIKTDAQIALQRRQVRGDRYLGGSNHRTEQGDCRFDVQIVNNGSLEEFEREVSRVLEDWMK